MKPTQFSPASFLFNSGINRSSLHQTPRNSGTTNGSTTTLDQPNFGTDRTTLGEPTSLGDQMKSLVSKFGKASSSWLNEGGQTSSSTATGQTPQQNQAQEQPSFQERFENSGWTVKDRDNNHHFESSKLDGKEIAFQTVDRQTGEVKEHRGTMVASRDHQTSALFRLEGSDQVFNNNDIDDLAVNQKFDQGGQVQGRALAQSSNASSETRSPESLLRRSVYTAPGSAEESPKPQTLSPERQQFRDKYDADGWTTKNETTNPQVNPIDIDRKEVAFQTVDRQTGEIQEHRGIMVASRDHQTSALFRLEGSDQVFNNNYIDEFAVNDSFNKKFEQQGWTVKDRDKGVNFAPADLGGKEVAFRDKDPQTGEMVERRGVLEPPSDRGSSLFTLKGQEGEFNNNYIDEFAVNDSFNKKFEQQGWTVKDRDKGVNFAPADLDGKEVAFRDKDPQTGDIVERRGVLEPPSDRGSSLFTLKGQEGEFNNNYIDEFAVNDSFDKKFTKEGWTVKGERNANEFAPDTMNGKEVAFRTPDPQTGEMVDHRGILVASEDWGSALFKLEGQDGEFNNNDIKEIALNDRFEKTYEKAGWNVRKPDNREDFTPEKLHGQEVVFQTPDSHGQMTQHQGVFQRSENPETPNLFTLEGWDSFFETDAISRMATRAKAAFSQFFGLR